MDLLLEDIYSLQRLDEHSRILIPFVKRSLEKTRRDIPLTHPYYKQIRRGAKQLWNNYFRYADEEDQTTTILEPLSTIVLRLRMDLSNASTASEDIKMYATACGIPLLKVIENGK